MIPLDITPKAQEQIKKLIQNRTDSCTGLRISLKTKGCSGLSYSLEFAKEAQAFDEIIDFQDFKVFIDPKALIFILGTQMDFIEETLQTGFTFKNPNEKGRCGCGKSFHV
ncbi:MAG TPA: iron-sulfur cluster assembly accessory protein [Alphaproteobacteria bacterium]|nr:iron-sulfur cluster assembly accessory protein [Alphaproteobacteria bacterium]